MRGRPRGAGAAGARSGAGSPGCGAEEVPLWQPRSDTQKQFRSLDTFDDFIKSQRIESGRSQEEKKNEFSLKV